jgi:hypothetical protein
VGVASPTLKQPIFMEMKPSQFSLGRHPLSDAPYWNPDIEIKLINISYFLNFNTKLFMIM